MSWICSECTFQNDEHRSNCLVCQTKQPVVVKIPVKTNDIRPPLILQHLMRSPLKLRPSIVPFNNSNCDTWLYPSNVPFREYQLQILRSALFQNTLVTLPTGLGKTFIAAVVMANIHRWYPEGKILFLAPTKPLVHQQVEACYRIVGIPETDIAELEGSTPPADRAVYWTNRSVFFCTPQTVANDIKNHSLDPSKVVCIIIDEAHKATKRSSVANIVSQVSQATDQFRLVALSATPGREQRSIQQLINILMISKIEVRSDQDPDVAPYIFDREVEIVKCDSDCSSILLKQFLVDVMNMPLLKLTYLKVIDIIDASQLHASIVMNCIQELKFQHKERLNNDQLLLADCCLRCLLCLIQSYALLLHQGPAACMAKINEIEHDEKHRSNQEMCRIIASGEFERLMTEGRRVTESQAVHPKVVQTIKILKNHFDSHQDRSTRIIIFSQLRSNVHDIARELSSVPGIRAAPFVGQGSSSSMKRKRDALGDGGENYDLYWNELDNACEEEEVDDDDNEESSASKKKSTSTRNAETERLLGTTFNGQGQAEQQTILSMFRSGEYNVLVSTCVAEEGIDIGDVDLIISFDASSSPIRMIQRMGRTGRKRSGKVIILVTKGKEEDKLFQSADSARRIQALLRQSGQTFKFYNKSPRMIPDHLNLPEMMKYDFSSVSARTIDDSLIGKKHVNSVDFKSRESNKTTLKPKKSPTLSKSTSNLKSVSESVLTSLRGMKPTALTHIELVAGYQRKRRRQSTNSATLKTVALDAINYNIYRKKWKEIMSSDEFEKSCEIVARHYGLSWNKDVVSKLGDEPEESCKAWVCGHCQSLQSYRRESCRVCNTLRNAVIASACIADSKEIEAVVYPMQEVDEIAHESHIADLPTYQTLAQQFERIYAPAVASKETISSDYVTFRMATLLGNSLSHSQPIKSSSTQLPAQYLAYKSICKKSAANHVEKVASSQNRFIVSDSPSLSDLLALDLLESVEYKKVLKKNRSSQSQVPDWFYNSHDLIEGKMEVDLPISPVATQLTAATIDFYGPIQSNNTESLELETPTLPTQESSAADEPKLFEYPQENYDEFEEIWKQVDGISEIPVDETKTLPLCNNDSSKQTNIEFNYSFEKEEKIETKLDSNILVDDSKNSLNNIRKVKIRMKIKQADSNTSDIKDTMDVPVNPIPTETMKNDDRFTVNVGPYFAEMHSNKTSQSSLKSAILGKKMPTPVVEAKPSVRANDGISSPLFQMNSRIISASLLSPSPSSKHSPHSSLTTSSIQTNTHTNLTNSPASNHNLAALVDLDADDDVPMQRRKMKVVFQSPVKSSRSTPDSDISERVVVAKNVASSSNQAGFAVPRYPQTHLPQLCQAQDKKAAVKRSVVTSVPKVDATDLICCACLSGEIDDDDDKIVICDGSCGCAVHEKCYEIKKLPTGDWFCDSCEQKRRSGRNPVCELCKQSDGMMRRSACGRFYCHKVCVLWTPELTVDNDGRPDNIHRINPDRKYLKCDICQRVGGAIVQCCKEECLIAFHPHCAVNNPSKAMLEIHVYKNNDRSFDVSCRMHYDAARKIMLNNRKKRKNEIDLTSVAVKSPSTNKSGVNANKRPRRRRTGMKLIDDEAFGDGGRDDEEDDDVNISQTSLVAFLNDSPSADDSFNYNDAHRQIMLDESVDSPFAFVRGRNVRTSRGVAFLEQLAGFIDAYGENPPELPPSQEK